MENQALSGGVSAILRSGLILENFRGMFLLSIWNTWTIYMNFDENRSQNVLETQTRLQKSAYTTKKNLIFRVLCSLFEQIPSGINRDIQTNPTWCGAKDSNKLCAPGHLATWISHTVNMDLCKASGKDCTGQVKTPRDIKPWNIINHSCIRDMTFFSILKRI